MGSHQKREEEKKSNYVSPFNLTPFIRTFHGPSNKHLNPNPINPGGRWRTCQRNVRLYTSSLIVSRRLLLEKLVVNTTLL
jgi:hypothetical protein